MYHNLSLASLCYSFKDLYDLRVWLIYLSVRDSVKFGNFVAFIVIS